MMAVTHACNYWWGGVGWGGVGWGGVGWGGVGWGGVGWGGVGWGGVGWGGVGWVRCNLCVTALTTVQTARQSGVSFTAEALECY